MVAEKVFAVIAESTRRDILEALAQESKAVGQLVDELGVSQPTVSKHLRVLREAGVVTMRAQGQKRFYGINTEPLALVSTWLDSLGAGITAASVSASAPQPVPGRAAAGAGTPGGLAVVASVPTTAATAAAAAVGSAPSASPVAVVPAAAVAREAAVAKAAPGRQAENIQAGSSAANHPASRATAEGTAGMAAAQAAAGRVAGNGAAAMPDKSRGAAEAAVIPSLAVSRQAGAVVQSHEGDGGVQGQISRSVGRAANKAADLLANLPALPAFRRRKD